MKLNNLGLTAFYQCAKLENMTKAASVLFVTQSALSQRISQLEDQLETTLFVREGKRLKLTHIGEQLFKYCQKQESFEEEFLENILSDERSLAGMIKVASYSSIMRSMMIEKFAPLIRENPKLSLDFQTYEVKDLLQVLQQGQVDFVITDFYEERAGIISQVIGYEEFVVIESKKYKTNLDVFLDHGPHDNATSDFFKSQNKIPKYKRSFMGDVYAIIDGVELGLGRAVMSKHLVENNKKIKILKGFKKYQRPITLYYYDRPYFSKLAKVVIKVLNSSN